MSRSIHTTRRSLARLEGDDVSRDDARAEAVAHARRDLRRKRAAKRGAASARRPRERGHTPPDAVAVTVVDAGANVWFPAGEDDVREVLGRLPSGVTDGLARVEMRLGRETQAELAAAEPGGEEPDPFTGRLSYPHFPGTWCGRIRGRYRPGAAAIELYAYAADPAHPLRAMWAPLLRLEALSVLAHEVAHHHDHAERVARGRWLAADREAVERYAETMQHEWTHAVVLPYLRERYPAEVTATERWVARYGGIALPFEQLADDPRATGRGGWVHAERLLWPTSGALRELANAFDRGEPAWACRRRFAGELYLQSRYDDVLAVIARVLRARPGDAETLLLKAKALLQLDRGAEALRIARRLVERDPADERAWEVAADACEALGRWGEAETAYARRLELADGDVAVHAVLLDRARMRIRRGHPAGARADLERIDCGGRPYLRRRVAKMLAEIEAAGG